MEQQHAFPAASTACHIEIVLRQADGWHLSCITLQNSHANARLTAQTAGLLVSWTSPPLALDPRQSHHGLSSASRDPADTQASTPLKHPSWQFMTIASGLVCHVREPACTWMLNTHEANAAVYLVPIFNQAAWYQA